MRVLCFCVGITRSSLFIANGAVGTDTAVSTEDTWSRGGGIMLRGADFSVEDVGCMHNVADAGGCLYIRESRGVVWGSLLESNTARLHGGNMGARFTQAVVVRDTVMKGGVCDTGDGGGLYVTDVLSGGIFLTNSTIAHNTAARRGGGVYVESGLANVVRLVNGSELRDNRARNGSGGGVHAAGAADAVYVDVSSRVYGNSAVRGGDRSSGLSRVRFVLGSSDGVWRTGTVRPADAGSEVVLGGVVQAVGGNMTLFPQLGVELQDAWGQPLVLSEAELQRSSVTLEAFVLQGSMGEAGDVWKVAPSAAADRTDVLGRSTRAAVNGLVDFDGAGVVAGPGSWVLLQVRATVGVVTVSTMGWDEVSMETGGLDLPYRTADEVYGVLGKASRAQGAGSSVADTVLVHVPRCRRGEYAVGSRCEACPAGTAMAMSDHTNTECAACEPGYSQPRTGSAVCSPCGAGRYMTNSRASGECDPCPAGTYSTVEGRSSLCVPCEAGRYSMEEGRSSECILCPAGRYSDSTGSVEVCTECPPGTYQPASGSSSMCISCPAGTASASTGRASSCEPCQPGTYRAETGGQECGPCPTGSYAPEAGSTGCRSCPQSEAIEDCGGRSISTAPGRWLRLQCKHCHECFMILCISWRHLASVLMVLCVYNSADGLCIDWNCVIACRRMDVGVASDALTECLFSKSTGHSKQQRRAGC